MKARRQLAQIVAEILTSRRQRNAEAHDLLGSFMRDKNLTDEQITDNVIGVLFAARDTTASVLTWIVKFLGENPAILEAVAVRYHHAASFHPLKLFRHLLISRMINYR